MGRHVAEPVHHAYLERQNVMKIVPAPRGASRWHATRTSLETHWRAVCLDHADEMYDWPLPPWMADETHTDWIDAALDAKEHDIKMHGEQPAMPRLPWLLRLSREERLGIGHLKP